MDPEVLIKHTPDIDLQGGILSGADRQLGRIAPRAW
jgi:hypothetical protein